MRKTLAAALLAAALIPTNAQALENEELLALVAMPLAVAAVSEVTDIPMSDLIDVVTLMNDASVPPAQFIEVVRYAPAALISETGQPRFVEFVRVQYDNGLRGSALVNSIEDRIQIYGMPGVDLDVTAPRVVDIEDDFIPRVVQTRVAEVRAHPHGGPPGQLKKRAGVQTGAEIVHGSKPERKNHVRDDDDRVVKRVIEDRPERVVTRRVDDDDKGRGKGRGQGRVKADDGGGKGKSEGKGKGKGKGGKG
jgi:hypothetical protein